MSRQAQWHRHVTRARPEQQHLAPSIVAFAFPDLPYPWPLVALCRLLRLALLSSLFPALIVGLLILTMFLVGRVVGLLAFVPPPRALDLAGVAVDLGLGDEVAPRDLLRLERTPPHRMLHRG